MQAINAIYDGNYFKPIDPVPVTGGYEVVITFVKPVESVAIAAFINPDDYDNDTDYLNAIPGMAEKLLAGHNTPLSECIPADQIWDDDDDV